MKTVAHVMMCRDKGKWVERAVRSVFAQTFKPFTMYFSCQESRDDTVEIVQRLANEYDGPNKLVILHCPHNDYRGYAGMITHWKWLQDQVEEDIIVDCSADDYNEPTRVEKVVQAFETYNPSYVGTRVQYETDTGTPMYQTALRNDQRSRFIHPGEAIADQVGSSGSMAFSRDLWHKHKLLPALSDQVAEKPWSLLDAVDVTLPIMALFERGFYYIDETLHHHTQIADLENTGMEGQLMAAKGEDLDRRNELNIFHNTHHWTGVMERIVRNGWWERLCTHAGAEAALRDKVFMAAKLWSDSRRDLTLRRIEPMGMSV